MLATMLASTTTAAVVMTVEVLGPSCSDPPDTRLFVNYIYLYNSQHA